jgi:hypothetical protein
VREELFEAAGLIVVRADSLDLRNHRVALLQRLVNGWRRGVARERAHDDWTLTRPAWYSARAGR